MITFPSIEAQTRSTSDIRHQDNRCHVPLPRASRSRVCAAHRIRKGVCARRHPRPHRRSEEHTATYTQIRGPCPRHAKRHPYTRAVAHTKLGGHRASEARTANAAHTSGRLRARQPSTSVITVLTRGPSTRHAIHGSSPFLRVGEGGTCTNTQAALGRAVVLCAHER